MIDSSTRRVRAFTELFRACVPFGCSGPCRPMNDTNTTHETDQMTEINRTE